MSSATIFEAKTNLSQLIKLVQKGETVIITSGRDKTPVAKLSPVQPVKKKRLGALETPGFVLGPGFFEPLDDDEIGDGVGL
jgi:antitoxin (DNA-binding transcriptional repressor) of toxin-antitoxin stability system